MTLLSKIGQAASDRMLQSTVNGARWRVLSKVRRVVLLFGDPLVKHGINGKVLELPLSHDLPIHRRVFPDYSESIGAIAAAVHAKYPSMTFIDVGSNIGDTVAIVRKYAQFPILCVEGNPYFAKILNRNVPLLGPDVEVSQSYLGDADTSLAAAAAPLAGTSRIAVDASAKATIDVVPLAKVLATHTRFAEPKFIKTDTDGYDCKILRGAIEVIRHARPVLFFEYDPHYLSGVGDDGLSLFDRLRDSDYGPLLFFDNAGDFLLMADISDRQLLKDLHRSIERSNGSRYYDICAFPREDEQIAGELREKFRSV